MMTMIKLCYNETSTEDSPTDLEISLTRVDSRYLNRTHVYDRKIGYYGRNSSNFCQVTFTEQ